MGIHHRVEFESENRESAFSSNHHELGESDFSSPHM
jgi:hypothetical protein